MNSFFSIAIPNLHLPILPTYPFHTTISTPNSATCMESFSTLTLPNPFKAGSGRRNHLFSSSTLLISSIIICAIKYCYVVILTFVLGVLLVQLLIVFYDVLISSSLKGLIIQGAKYVTLASSE